MNDLVEAHQPGEVQYSIKLTYYINRSDSNKAVAIQSAVQAAVQNYTAWHDLSAHGIGNRPRQQLPGNMVGQDGGPVDPTDLEELRRILGSVKRLSSWMDEIITIFSFDPETAVSRLTSMEYSSL